MPNIQEGQADSHKAGCYSRSGSRIPLASQLCEKTWRAPVSGNLVQYKVITGDVYLEVTADVNRQRIGHIPRFMKPHQGLNQPNDVEAQDTPGY